MRSVVDGAGAPEGRHAFKLLRGCRLPCPRQLVRQDGHRHQVPRQVPRTYSHLSWSDERIRLGLDHVIVCASTIPARPGPEWGLEVTLGNLSLEPGIGLLVEKKPA